MGTAAVAVKVVASRIGSTTGPPTETVGTVPKPPRGKGTAPPSQRDPQRVFTPKQQQEKLAQQGGVCPACGDSVKDLSKGRGHHVKRHADGGRTTQGNHVVVHDECHKKIHSP
jgi:hypothetical protein